MNSPFLYLYQRKLTLKIDSERYEELASNTNKKMAWRLFSSICLCKLYDLSSLPKPFSQKIVLYTTFLFIVGAFSTYHESARQVNLLLELDEKYRAQFEEYKKSSGFEAIAWYELKIINNKMTVVM